VSDELAFLETQKANPADDTARLVYADWLDEHHEPAKAEYLRLIVVLAMTDPKTLAADQPNVRRILSLVPSLPLPWRASAGRRFSFIFKGSDDPAKKPNTMVCIREITGVGLAEAKRMYEQPPCTLLGWVLFEQAIAARTHFLRVPSTHIEIGPTDAVTLQSPVCYRIIARYFGRHQNAEHDALETGRHQARDTFTDFLQTALGITLTEARGLAQKLAQSEEVTLAESVELAFVLGRVEELRAALTPSDGRGNWSMWVRSEPIAIGNSDSVKTNN
jgi:uncharacterized protein (TIGR02996 family)